MRDTKQSVAAAHHMQAMVSQTAAAHAAGAIHQRCGAHGFFRQLDGGRRHEHRATNDRLVVGLHAIQMPQRFRRGGILLGNRCHRITALYLVACHAQSLLGRERQQRLFQAFGHIGRHQQAVRSGRVGRPTVKGRVKFVQVVFSEARQFGGDLQIDLPTGGHLFEIGCVIDLTEFESIGAGVRHNAAHRQ